MLRSYRNKQKKLLSKEFLLKGTKPSIFMDDEISEEDEDEDNDGSKLLFRNFQRKSNSKSLKRSTWT